MHAVLQEGQTAHTHTHAPRHTRPHVLAHARRRACPNMRMRVVLSEMGAAAGAGQLALLLSRLQAPPAQLLMSSADAQHISRALQEGLGGWVCAEFSHWLCWGPVVGARRPVMRTHTRRHTHEGTNTHHCK